MPTPLKYSMPIKTKGNLPPLFCVHGEPLKIAMRLQADRPVYGVSYAYHDFRRSEMPQTVEEYARLYLADIRAIQPKGPYYICGYSVGGMIAYEIAKQLCEAGEELGHLTLVEPTLLNAGATRMGGLVNQFSQSNNRASLLFSYIRRQPAAVWERTKKLVRLSVTRMYLKLDKQFPQNLRLSGLLMAIKPIMLRYEYKPVDAAASLIYTSLDNESLEMCREYWSERFSRGVELLSIVNTRRHLDLMEEPALGQSIAILDKSVTKAE